MQSESRTLASYFGSGACPAEPRVMLLATAVVEAKPLYGNNLAADKVVELRQRERTKQKAKSY